MASLIDKALTWKDIAWLRSVTSLKIVVKGIMTAEDALTAVRNGVDGMYSYVFICAYDLFSLFLLLFLITYLCLYLPFS